jgi:hypothetical protein
MVRPYAAASPSSTTAATEAGSPRRGPLTGSSTVAAVRTDFDPFTRGATTGWLAVGGTSEPLPGGNDGSPGSDTAGELWGVCCGVGVLEGEGVALVVADGVACDFVGFGVGV